MSRATVTGVWPLRVDRATLRCERGRALVLDVGGETYALNAAARRQGWQRVDAIAACDPEHSGCSQLDRSELLERGYRLCGD